MYVKSLEPILRLRVSKFYYGVTGVIWISSDRFLTSAFKQSLADHNILL